MGSQVAWPFQSLGGTFSENQLHTQPSPALPLPLRGAWKRLCTWGRGGGLAGGWQGRGQASVCHPAAAKVCLSWQGSPRELLGGGNDGLAWKTDRVMKCNVFLMLGSRMPTGAQAHGSKMWVSGPGQCFPQVWQR